MDWGTVAGLILGILCTAYGLADCGVPLFIYWSPSSVAVTIGGATAGTMAAVRLSEMSLLWKTFKIICKPPRYDSIQLIRTLVRFAEIARKDGILALEGALEGVTDDFLIRGIQMAVDGSDPELIYQNMSTEISYLDSRHADGKRMWDMVAKYNPAWGLIGTLIGLVALLYALDDPSAIGRSMSVALLTTLYGALVANYLALPMSDKCALRNAEELAYKQIIIQGVMSIQSGDNPKIVEQKLKIYLSPAEREELVKQKEQAA